MDYRKEFFPMNNFALYAKGWYKQTENTNFSNFIISLLELDGYQVLSVNDAMLQIVAEFEEYNNWLKENRQSLYTDIFYLITHIKDETDNKLSFNISVIKAIAKIIRMMPNDVIKLKCPIYSRYLYTKGIACGTCKQGSSYKEQNKYAIEFFKNLSQYK